ncbi:MAG: dihydrofolate reductase family protein [Rhodospirillaceae bacterium]
MPDVTFRLYAATSLDGFIADAEGGIAWLSDYNGEDYGTEAFMVSVDALVMGRATYDQVRTFGDWPYPGKRVWVLTTQPLDEGAPPGVKAMADPAALVETLRTRGGLVWIVGGGQTVLAFLDLGAVDEIEVFVMPILLGAGVPLLPPGASRKLTLLETETYRTGAVRLLYGVA